MDARQDFNKGAQGPLQPYTGLGDTSYLGQSVSSASSSSTATSVGSTIQHNGTDVAVEPKLDFEDSATCLFTVTDDSTHTRVKVSAAFDASALIGSAYFQWGGDSYSPGDGTGSYTMTGFALANSVAITPAYSGRVHVICDYAWLGAFTALKWMYGTGTAPANHAAVTGTHFGPELSANQAGTLSAIITGLTKGTTYWIDMAYNAGAGAPRFKHFTAVEF